MDILTHAVMGAVCAAGVASLRAIGQESALAGPRSGVPGGQGPRRRLAAGVGALAGLLPDADALIQSGRDALLAALMLWPLLRGRMNFGLLYACCLAGYLPHPLLDACTSYGTHLWLPFSQTKAAWNLIAVVDPAFTLLLAVPLFLFLRRAASKAVTWALVLGAAYLGVSFLQQQRAEAAAVALAKARGHAATQLSVKPSMANLVLWRSLYVHDGQVQVDAFHQGLTSRHYPGESAALLDLAAAQNIAAGDPRRLADIERFRVFSDGFIVLDRRHPGFVGDARYAMQPTAIAPIWGLEWRGAGAATEFVSRHEFSPAMRREFFAMLLGRDLP